MNYYELPGYFNKLYKTSTNQDTVNASVFIQQWAMAFVGENSVCLPNWYTSAPVEFGTGDEWRTAIPDVVRWQLSRRCDVQYESGKWNHQGAPWCCNYPKETAVSDTFHAYEDEAFALRKPPGTGGCPDGHCPAYATGRTCRECRNSAFTHHMTTEAGVCAATPFQDVTEGYCTKCVSPFQSGNHTVAPYTYYDAATQWPSPGKGLYADGGGCQACVTSSYMKSGVLKYISPALAQYKDAVCNYGTPFIGTAHGHCMGQPTTYSGRGIAAPDELRVKLPDGGAGTLLCPAGVTNTSASLQLGLCQCTEDYNGPTCAMPKTVKACGGELAGSVWALAASPYADGEQYHVCKCKPPFSGFYCQYSSKGQQSTHLCNAVELIARVPTQIACNGEAECSANGCGSSCADPYLDPFTYCREYKAIGPYGIRARHQQEVAQKAENCSAATAADIQIGFDCSVPAHEHLLECTG